MLTRDQFCSVTGHDSEALKSLSRRNQLPFGSTREAGRRHGTYSFFEAFLAILSDYLANEHGFSLGHAASIVASAAKKMAQRWPEIAAAGDGIGVDDAEPPVLCGYIVGAGRRDSVVCIETEITEIREKYRPVSAMFLMDASAGAAVLIRRAHRAKIALPESFWTEVPQFTPRPTVNLVATMKRLLSEEGK
jgi:hypothetical protein